MRVRTSKQPDRLTWLLILLLVVLGLYGWDQTRPMTPRGYQRELWERIERVREVADSRDYDTILATLPKLGELGVGGIEEMLEVLFARQDRDAVGDLLPILGQLDRHCCRAAAEACLATPDPRVVPALVALLEKDAHAPHHDAWRLLPLLANEQHPDLVRVCESFASNQRSFSRAPHEGVEALLGILGEPRSEAGLHLAREWLLTPRSVSPLPAIAYLREVDSETAREALRVGYHQRLGYRGEVGLALVLLGNKEVSSAQRSWLKRELTQPRAKWRINVLLPLVCGALTTGTEADRELLQQVRSFLHESPRERLEDAYRRMTRIGARFGTTDELLARIDAVASAPQPR